MAIDPVSLGIQVALMAAQMALGASRKIEGPRLDDLTVTLADYGTPLNYFKGACRFDGPPIFWKEDLREIKTRSKTKGGKYNDYRYTGSWANMIAGQEIDGVTRIFMDRHLVYDRTGAGPVTPFSIGYSQRSGKTGGSRDVNINLTEHMRVYLGTETQEPDSRMLQEVEARKGAGYCPAHRGTAYVLFEEIPLDKFGNRIPQISVEAVSSSNTIYPSETFETIISQPANLWGFTFSTDYSRMMWGAVSNYEIWDVAARTRMIKADFSTQMALQTVFGMYQDGRILSVGELFPSVGNQKLYQLDPDGFASGEVTEFVGVGKKQQEVRVRRDVNGTEHWMTVPWSSIQYFYVDGTDFRMVDLTGVSWTPYEYFESDDGSIWAVGREVGAGTDAAHFYRIFGDGIDPDFITVTGLPAIGIGIGNISGCWSNGAFILAWAPVIGADCLYRIDPSDGSIIDSRTDLSFDSSNFNKQFANLRSNSDSIWLNNQEISLIDLTTIRSVTMTDWLAADADGVIFDPINQALITAPQFDQEISWRYLDRISGGGVTLRNIVEHVANLAGIDAAAVDATALTQNVPGYKWTRGSGKDVIEPLLDLYAADCRPHGFGVQFVNRGGAAGALISSENFAMVDGDEPLYAFTTPGGSDMPARLTLSFSDIDSEFQTNNVPSRRPLDAVDSKSELSIDMTPLSLSADEARPLTDRLFRQYWIARKGWSHALTAEYIDLEPGDVRTLDLESIVHTAKLLSMAVDADGAIAVEWQRDDPSVHVLNGEAGAGMDGHQPSTILIPGLSKGVVLDLPLAIDAHDQPLPFLYYAAAPYSSGGYWPGVDFSVSDTGILEDYAAGWGVVPAGDAMDWGYATGTLPDALPWIFDRGSVLNVRMQVGTLTSTTEDMLLANGALNLILLGQEYLQFTTATLQGDGSYNLTSLLRGCRGTEQHIEGHAAGDTFIVIDAQVLRRDVGAGEIGDTDFYRPVVQGRSVESATEQSLTFGAAAHRPYSPVHGVLLRDTGSNDWTISATRRSRIGGANVDGSDVPLGEVSEAWQADVMDGATVKRTLSGMSLPLIYTSAQQVADWGSNQTVLDVNLYQMSPALSLRGFPLNIAA